MKSHITRWVSPQDPRGMSVWGTVATLILSVGLWRVNGTLPEVWPNRCSLLQGQLRELVRRGEGLSVIAAPTPQADERAQTLTALDLWDLSAPEDVPPHNPDSSSWLVPRGDYIEARVRAHHLTSGTATLFVELVTRSHVRVSAYLAPDRDLSQLYDYLIGASYARSSDHDRLAPTLRESVLRRQSLTLTPDALTCQPERAERELVEVAALMLKDETLGLKRAWLIDATRWLTERIFEEKRQRRLYQIIGSSQGTNMLWVSTWQPRLLSPEAQGAAQSSRALSSPPRWLKLLAYELQYLNKTLEVDLKRLRGQTLIVNNEIGLRDGISRVAKSLKDQSHRDQSHRDQSNRDQEVTKIKKSQDSETLRP